MKRLHHILTALLLLALAGLSTSCLKDQKDLFDKTAAARMQDALSNAKNVLTSASNGWKMEYYAGNSQADWGGYNLVLQFTDTEVTATSERDASLTTTTYYKLTTDDGPVLSFDTYTEVLHYFATPAGSGSLYQGRGGDYEFLILEATSQKVVLKGKRSGKICTLYPLSGDGNAFLTSILEKEEAFVIGEAHGTLGDKKTGAEFDLDHHQIYLFEEDAEGNAIDSTEVSSPFIFTTTGIKLYDTLNVNGASVTYFDFDNDTFLLTTSEASGSLTGIVPEDYLKFDFFEGEYDLKMYRGTYPVTPTKGEGKTYILSGVSSMFDLTLDYITAKGRLHLGAQIVGTYNGNSVVMAPWSLSGGGTLYPTALDCGLELVWNLDREHPVFTFTNDGSIDGFTIDSFILWLVTDAGSSAGAASMLSSWFVWRSYQWPYVGDGGGQYNYTSLTKK